MLEATAKALAAALDNNEILERLCEIENVSRIRHRVLRDDIATVLAETRQSQDILLALARQLVGGLSPAEVEAAQAEARELVLGLQRSRQALATAVKSQSEPPPEGTKT